MASAWNRIGVDWEDLSNTRLEPVINEIYKATIERDYWLRVTGKELNLNPPNNNTVNSSKQLRDIYSIFETWFRPISTSSSRSLDFNESVYLADDGLVSEFPSDIKIRQMYFTTPYGKDSYNYISGGNLSSLVGYDMSFLGDGVPNGRVNIEHLQVFYKILNLNLKNRLFTLTYSTSLGFYNSFRMNSDIVSEVIITGTLDSGSSGDIINDFNVTSNSNEAISSNFSNQYNFNFSQRGGSGSEATYDYALSKRFFYMRNYNTDDFDFFSYVYSEETVDGNLEAEYTPTTPSNEIILNNFIDVIVDGGSLTKAYMPYPTTVLNSLSGDDFGDDIQVIYSSQNFIYINNNALLEYYTEEAN